MEDQERIQTLRTLWGLQGYTVVRAEVEVSPTTKEPGRRILVVSLDNDRGRHRCPHCGKEHEVPGFEEYLPRRFRDSSLGDYETYVEITPMRVACCGGMMVEEFPWESPGGHRMTRRFFERIAALCHRLPVQQVADMASLSWDTVARIDQGATRLALGGDAPDLDGLRWIGVDEVSRTGGRVYFTIITDLESGHVVWVGDGKGKATLESFFEELGKKRLKKIKGVVSDLAAGYVKAIQKYLPKVRHVLDRFHIFQWVNDAVDSIRRKVFGAAPQDGIGKTMKVKRWVLLRAKERLSRTDRGLLRRLKKANHVLYEVYLLKEELRAILHHRWVYLGSLTKNLKMWAVAVMKTGQDALIAVANRIIANIDKVLAAYGCDVKLGLVESINGQIALIRRQCRGFRNQDYFRFKIYQRLSLVNNPWAAIIL